MKKTTQVAVLAVLAVALSAVPVWATCNPAKVMTQFSSSKGLYQYTDWDDNQGTQPADIVGRYWQTGDYATANSGDLCVAGPTCWFRKYAATGRWYINANLGAGGIGCPANKTTGEVFNLKTGEWVGWTVCEINTPGCTSSSFGFPAFDVAQEYPFDFAPTVLRPRATSSSRSGPNVTVNLQVSEPYYRTKSATSELGQLQIYRAISATRPSPSIVAGGWSLVGALPTAGGSGAFTADCANPATDNWFATAVVLAGQPAEFVSTPTQVECDPNLADPNGRFRMIDKSDTDTGGKKSPTRERR